MAGGSARTYRRYLRNTRWVKKQDTKLLSIRSPNIDRFSSFFHCYTQQEIYNKVSLKNPSHLNCVATLPCEILVSENVSCPICWGTVLLKYKLTRDLTRIVSEVTSYSLAWQFASVISLSLNTSNQDRGEKVIHTTPDCAVWCSERWQLYGWSCVLSPSSSTTVTFSLPLSRFVCRCCAFDRCNFFTPRALRS